MDIKDIPTAELTALVEQGLPLAEYEAEIARRKALAAVPVMGDLVERLRKHNPYNQFTDGPLVAEAGWEIERLHTALTLANARIARLEEALKPFARAADIKLCGEWKDDEYVGRTDTAFYLTFGDLRRARAALKGGA